MQVIVNLFEHNAIREHTIEFFSIKAKMYTYFNMKMSGRRQQTFKLSGF